MHLADYDDVLVTSRIWTEPQHIEQRLTDLTEQMENIIQKYLRNEFKTIEEYNAHAGEVAEAFRILVVANFPSGFTESSARRLISIISSGARCGVYTFMTVDANQMMPPGIDLNDIVPYCTCLLWKDGQFIWRDPDFRPFELSVDRSPDDAQFSKLVHMAGESAKDSRRVEVPFDYIAPRPETYWKGSTSDGVNIALGRAGATKLQYMRLGQGTSQHVLIAGKTGSGKSTLLHALVTNLALTYSPDEIELYLIDFKKGVEFKTYATHELPHARVIAIESEREFGLSVLQNLDAELRKRGDLFRATNAQDLKSYRAAVPKAVLPRMLLIIDEFHELFVEDDKIAQDAALLLDRLVRQGRAFGIHILLGSQTLGGAYSLARSTIGQMGIRIALQCSEADAHLILSEENTAARLLSRPGEAIYNDAGGLLEGNNPFQVVWLSDARRDDYLDLVTALDAARPRGKQLRQIVFEGNAPADIRRNELLQSSFNQAPWFTGSVSAASSGSSPHGAVTTGSVPTSALAWFGEAVAIKEPTAARFKRENANNLLIIGQREEAAAALLASTMLSIAAQYPPANSIDQGAGARFYVLESPRADGQQAHRLSELAAIIPHSVQVAGRRELPEMLELLAVEVKRRHAANDSAAVPELFLMIHDLARFRDLRRDENDMGFSFGSEPKKATPDKLWSVILRDGPPVGIHTVCWCDNLANLNRAVDRQVMREFDLRILFQMSPSDSSTLVDTPIASKLGQQLALFQNDEAGVLEKFRPYRWPDQQWLAELSRQTRSQATADSDGVVPTAAR
ncbi:MAG: FtsK/SpoIIIE domain-containing protein, partial [Planctomycetota bacterium]|nr:FtsK/SpoIIIE domain-containing protein [Planctomycetota bacterium]